MQFGLPKIKNTVAFSNLDEKKATNHVPVCKFRNWKTSSA